VVDFLSGSATRFRLVISYDGTDFHGWAAQRDLRTVEGELAVVLRHLTGHPVELTCAGRTDAGVHARGQVAHFDSPSAGELSVGRINRALPADVRVVEYSATADEFDARFAALWRRYSYTVSDDPRGPNPMQRRYQLDLPSELDIDAMNHAAADLVGEHDFTSFCKLKEHGTTIRAIEELRWERRLDPTSGLGVAVMNVRADAFCHSMVRSLAGALIPVGQGRRPRSYPREALEKRSRDAGVAVLPPHPLVLEEVGYPPEGEWADRQRRTRVVRSPST
jgi:tRNA pseudouridine38-40 synthase